MLIPSERSLKKSWIVVQKLIYLIPLCVPEVGLCCHLQPAFFNFHNIRWWALCPLLWKLLLYFLLKENIDINPTATCPFYSLCTPNGCQSCANLSWSCWMESSELQGSCPGVSLVSPFSTRGIYVSHFNSCFYSCPCLIRFQILQGETVPGWVLVSAVGGRDLTADEACELCFCS